MTASRGRTDYARFLPYVLLLAVPLVSFLGCTTGPEAREGDHKVADPLLAGGATEANGRREKRPNVVVILTDDQNEASVRVMRKVEHKLRDEGTTFENFFATFPLCCPSRATLLTGQYAHNHGVLSNRPPSGGYEAFDDSDTLPVALKDEGYRTGWVGKYLNGYGKRDGDRTEIPAGWDDWYAPVNETESRMFGFKLNENGRTRRYAKRPRNYQTDVFARKATRFIRESRDREPFFLVMATGAPHGERGRTRYPNPRPAPRHRGRFKHVPLPRPPSFNPRDVSDKPFFVRERKVLGGKRRTRLEERNRARLGSLMAVDDAVGRIVRTLNEEDELRDTLVIFTSDNGFLLGEHRLGGKNRRFWLYEELAGVPLIMRGPGIPKDSKRWQITGNIDLVPTILDLAGAEPARVLDGRSLLPLLRDRHRAARRAVLLETESPARARAVRTRDYMYAEYGRPGGEIERELYDMRADRFQLKNKDRNPKLEKTRQKLARRLEVLRDCTGHECR